MGKLTPTQVDEYFNVHLPYRTGILLAHYRIKPPFTDNLGLLNASFVASLVTGRLFLNVLGVGKARVSGIWILDRFRPQPTDVTVDDLGGVPLDPAALPTNEQDLLLPFIVMADQAAAHFTVPAPHDWTKTHEVILLIHRYLKTNLYDPTGRPFPDATP
jgi:hypothetical protein